MTIPQTIQLLFEAKNMPVQIELCDNTAYKGVLKQVDYNMNVELCDAVSLQTKERQKHILIRGSQIKFVKLPDLLAKSPLFTKTDQK